MTIFSVFLFLLTYMQTHNFETAVHFLAAPAQYFCTNLLSTNAKHVIFYKAIACGSKVQSSQYDILKTVSLWHLVIVSAGHFKVIEWVAKKVLPQHPRFHHILLLLFCFWTGAQPPVVRAYLHRLINQVSHRFKLWIPPVYSILYSSTLILLLFPSWSGSWSFLLSWLCIVLLQYFHRQTLLRQCLGISIGVFPVMCFFSTPHPLSFLFNYILGPPLSLFLFPVCLLMLIFPELSYWMDPIMDAFLFILSQIVNQPPEIFAPFTFFSSKYFLFICWIYVLGLQIGLLIKERKTNAIL